MKLVTGLLCCFSFIAFGQDTPPPQQPPPTVPGTPPTAKPKVEVPPEPQGQPSKAPPPERDTLGDSISIMPFYWYTTQQPDLHKGHGSASTTTLPGEFNFNGHLKYAYGGVITIPTTRENSLQFTYFRRLDQGNTVLGTEHSYFGQVFAAGDVVAAHYTIQSFKLSWNYLTYPYPSAGAKFRLKTLWEVQYATIKSNFDAPADANASPAEGRKSIVLPTLGLGIEYHASKHVVFEAKGSGFGIPHHADIWDTEANLVFRASHFELVAGGKAWHFKTSPQGDYYYTATMIGPYGGLRYIFK